jgi:Domain of unknown function (DUF4340)
MNPRTLKRLAVVLGILVVAWVGLGLAQRLGRDREGRIRLASFDPGYADGALVVHHADTLRFVRRGAAWLVNGHAANAGFVTDMLRGLADTTAPSELVSERASSLPQLGLDSASAWSVTALLGRRVLGTLLLGTRGTTYSSVYARRPGATTAYLLTQGQLAGITDRLPDDWRDKTIAKVAPESVAVVQVRRGARGYTLTRGAAGWKLGQARADSTAVAALLSQFRDLEAAGFASPAQADSARGEATTRQVTLEAKGGRPLLVLEMDSTIAGYWTRRQGDSTTWRLDGWTADQLTPADSILRPKQARRPPSRVTASSAGRRPGSARPPERRSARP